MADGLYVQTLGRFVVWQDGNPLPEQVWRRAAARQLFQFLLTYHRRFWPRERITADLWPTIDNDKAHRDFKVALNALNAALEPDRPPRTMPKYVLRQGASYMLNWQAPIQVDTQEMESMLTNASRTEANQPEQAVRQYQQALALYAGEYLPDAIYEDWASAERERMTMLYLTGATQLAALLLRFNNLVEAIIWGQRIIAIDPCWEEAYRLLMQAHQQSGNRPQAVRVYQQCQTALQNELGLEPMGQTIRLYHQIVNER